jgi:hypothetical protein
MPGGANVQVTLTTTNAFFHAFNYGRAELRLRRLRGGRQRRCFKIFQGPITAVNTRCDGLVLYTGSYSTRGKSADSSRMIWATP